MLLCSKFSHDARSIRGIFMKSAPFILLTAVTAALLLECSVWAQSVPVEKSASSPKVYMHYMPWFQTPASLGGTSGSDWGWHWKMNTQNPNVVDASGKRQIAAHYYPKIGPYDSTDPKVIEYHSLLMKYSGVDGALVDWYGVQGSNGDVGSLLTASNAFINQTANYGLNFGVVLEDRFARNVADEQANMSYLGSNYINRPNYIKAGPTSSPLLPIFGPITFTTSSQWNQILPSLGADPEFLTLPGKSSLAGSNADGEYAWPYQDANTTNHLSKLRSFYQSSAPFLKTAGGVAYPGFNDFYQQGGAGSTLFYIPENNGQTLNDTLSLYNDWSTDARSGLLDFLQLATFNDFGEGTMFEPTVETGFTYLHELQVFTGAKDPATHRALDESDLQLVYQLYLARKEYASNSATQALLNQVSTDLATMQIDAARTLLNQVSPAGDYNGDGIVNSSDYNAWRNSLGSSTIIYGSGVDGNYDGAINAADYVTWRSSLSAATATGTSTTAVPEPKFTALLGLTIAVLFVYCRSRP